VILGCETGRRAISPFGALISESANNIYVHANDTIYLYHEPQTFLAFGAVGTQQQVPFGAWRVSLGGGHQQDRRASRRSSGTPPLSFSIEVKARDIAEAMGIDCSPYHGPMIPVIYVINLHDPSGYFLASSFEMRKQ